jgi:hypothetical protein
MAGEYGQFSDDPGAVRLSHVRLTNFSYSGDFVFYPVQLVSHAADTLLEDVQIDHLQQSATNTACAIGLELDEDSLASLRYVTVDLSNYKKLCFVAGQSAGDYAAEIYNSIIWGSDGTGTGIATVDDFDVSNSFNLKFVNSTYINIITGPASVSSSGSMFTDPQWALPSNGNYHLNLASPALNTGTLIVPQGSPGTDIEATAHRRHGADRGASESPFNNLQVFTVTNTSTPTPTTSPSCAARSRRPTRWSTRRRSTSRFRRRPAVRAYTSSA